MLKMAAYGFVKVVERIQNLCGPENQNSEVKGEQSCSLAFIFSMLGTTRYSFSLCSHLIQFQYHYFLMSIFNFLIHFHS